VSAILVFDVPLWYDLGVDALVDLVRVPLLLLEGEVLNRNGVHSSRHLEGPCAEVLLEQCRVQGGRSDDDLEVLALCQDVLDEPDDNVNADGPFVGLVNHKAGVFLQQWILLDLVE
jgi:hypothetical protein